MVYFIKTDDNNYIKIGFALDISRRLSVLQCYCPYYLSIELIIEGDYKKEIELHNQFKNSHKIGEWFYYSNEIKEFIKASCNNCLPIPDKQKGAKKSNRSTPLQSIHIRDFENLKTDYINGLPMVELMKKYKRSHTSIDGTMKYFDIKRQRRATEELCTNLFYTCIDGSKLPIFKRRNNDKLFIHRLSRSGIKYCRYLSEIVNKHGQISYVYESKKNLYSESSKRKDNPFNKKIL